MFHGNRSNNILKGGLIVGGCFAAITLVFIWLVDYEFNRYKILDSQHIYRACLSLVAIVLSLLIIRLVVTALARLTNKKYCQKFKLLDEYGAFKETKARWFFSKPITETKKVVLFLHAFGSSPHDFNGLYDKLEKLGISYFAPNLLGFGIEATSLLEKISYHDWFREALMHYDMLAALFDDVTVMGNSMGGILATYLAETRQPSRVILSGPGVYSAEQDLGFRKVITNKWLIGIISFVMPYFPKPLRPNRVSTIDSIDDTHVDASFQYLVFPFNCIRQVAYMQDHVETYLDKISDLPLLLLYGKHDQVTDCVKLVEKMKPNRSNFEYCCLPNSAHTILIDFDRDEVIDRVINFVDK
jgi:carboxylesterase